MKGLLILCLLFALTLGGTAQDPTESPAEPPERTPFLRALALIPDIPSVREATPLFSYADYGASMWARNLVRPEQFTDYREDGEVYGRLLPVLPLSGASDLIQFLEIRGGAYPETLGFDFFAVHQSVGIGVPPEYGQILLGGFGRRTVEAAYTARGYTVEREAGSGVLLCSETGCESGAQIDFSNVNPGNPFGGDLGHREPIFVDGGVLLNSPHFPLLEAMIATYEGSGASLADAPEFQAIAGVLDDYPYVMSVMVLPPSMFEVLELRPATEAAQIRLREAITAQLQSMPVARYQISAFASAADETSEYGLALLVYADAGAAEQAAASIDARLAEMHSRRMPERLYAEILMDGGTLEPSMVVTDEATGLSVVVVRASTPMPSNEPDSTGRIPSSHRQYWRFWDMIKSRDAHWLIWGSGAK